MDSSYYKPRLRFWIATTLAITLTVFPIILFSIAPGNGGGRAAELRFIIGLTLFPGTCIGFLQALMITFPSRLAQLKWFGITVIGTAGA